MVKAEGRAHSRRGQAQADRGCAGELCEGALAPNIFVFPVPALALCQPFDRCGDALFPRRILLRFSDPFEIFAAVARREASNVVFALGALARAAAKCGCKSGTGFGACFVLRGAGALSASSAASQISVEFGIGGRSSTLVSLPNWPMAPALGSSPISCPRQKLSAACSLKAAVIEQDLAVATIGRRAPLDRFFDVGDDGVDAFADLLEDRTGERLRLGDISVDARIPAHKILLQASGGRRRSRSPAG